MMNYVYCYKMTWDTEFAPNPHCNFLTLATCKPVIRRCAQVGDWISGWTAITVKDKEHQSWNFRDCPKLIYLAKITAKVNYDVYWRDYPKKRPNKCESGDNIYEPKGDDFFQHANAGEHGEADKAHDLKGKHVLICEEFYYFGVRDAIHIDWEIFPYKVPRCKKIIEEDAKKFIQYVQNNKKLAIYSRQDEDNIKQERF